MAENRFIIDDGGEENREHYQPEATLSRENHFNQIRFTKKAADAVNIYRRKSADEHWEFIATAVNSPFDDHDAEVIWEYKICCVKGNAEIGVPVVLSVSKTNSSSD